MKKYEIMLNNQKTLINADLIQICQKTGKTALCRNLESGILELVAMIPSEGFVYEVQKPCKCQQKVSIDKSKVIETEPIWTEPTW